jgi:nicotinamidase-related amidase
VEGFIEVDDRHHFVERMKQVLVIDPLRTVVMTVDMQRKYLDMTIARTPVLPDEAERVLTGAKDLLDFSRSHGIPVIHAYTVRRPIEIEKRSDSATYWSMGRSLGLSQLPHVPELRDGPDRLEGSEEAEIPRVLRADTDIHMVTKKRMDAYLGSDLDYLLAALKPETVVLTGINTDTCVYSTTFSTANRGYHPVVISDCVASMRGKDVHRMALEVMSRGIAWVLTVDEFKAKICAVRDRIRQHVGGSREVS